MRTEQEKIINEFQTLNSEKLVTGKNFPNVIAIRDKIGKITEHAEKSGYELLMVNKDGSAVSSIYFKKDRNDGSAILFVTKERTLVSVVYIKGRFSTRDLMTTFSRFK